MSEENIKRLFLLSPSHGRVLLSFIGKDEPLVLFDDRNKKMKFYIGSLAFITVFMLDPLLTGGRTFGNLTPLTDDFVYPLAVLWTCWQFSTLSSTMIKVELIFSMR
jgi:hypothetical protein